MLCDWGPFEARLAVGCADVGGRIRRVLFLYGVFSAYNWLRHCNVHGNVVEVCTNIVRSKIIYVLGRSSRQLRQMYDNLNGCSVPVGRTENGWSVGDVIFNFRKRSTVTRAPEAKRAKIVDQRQRLRAT